MQCKVPFSEKKEISQALFEHYFEADLTQKVDSMAQKARQLMGLGLVEANPLCKQLQVKTLKELTMWYLEGL